MYKVSTATKVKEEIMTQSFECFLHRQGDGQADTPVDSQQQRPPLPPPPKEQKKKKNNIYSAFR